MTNAASGEGYGCVQERLLVLLHDPGNARLREVLCRAWPYHDFMNDQVVLSID
jgi:hypothetical protein